MELLSDLVYFGLTTFSGTDMDDSFISSILFAS